MNNLIKIKIIFIIALTMCVGITSVYATDSKGGSVGTATVGGTYYIWSGPWNQIVREAIPDYSLNIEVTGGPVHNIKLIERGEIEYGTVSMPAAYDAWNGQEWAKKKYHAIRTLFPMYPSYATFYALESSGIKNIRDLENKIFSPGPKGGTPDQYYRELFKLLNIKPKNIVNTGMNDIPGQMTDGMIDAAAGSGGEPFAPAVEVDSTNTVQILDISQEDMDAFIKKYPSWYIGMRPAGGYKTFTTPRPTLMYWNIFVCHESISDELAYKLVDAFFKNINDFESIYRETCNTRPQDVLNSCIPIHPGAARWYKEHGVEIPANLIQ